MPRPVAEAPIAFGRRLAGSSSFKALFDDGIALIEETAAYLDSEGRMASKTMSGNGKLAYATLSMKLTTRLMSLASWLLVQRAVNEGEMTPETGRSEHDKVKLGEPLSAPDKAGDADMMPEGLVDLFGRCADLQHRVLRLDAILQDEADDNGNDMRAVPANAVASQLNRLENAFQ